MADENNNFDGIKYRIETKSPAVFTVLTAVLILWGGCFIAYYLFSGWSSEGEFVRNRQAKQEQLSRQPAGGASGTEADREGKPEDYLALGKKEFAERCAACHGPDGRGGIGSDLTRREYKYGRTEAAVTESIRNGRPGGMPGFGSDLSHEKIEGLAQYILSL